MSISRKTPLPDHEAFPAQATTEPPVSDISRSDGSPLQSDVAPARHLARRSTEPPTVVTLGQEELLRVSARLPLEQGPEAVARMLATTVAEVVAPCAVAIVLPRAHGEPAVVLAVSADVGEVDLASPAAAEGPPRRMFPTLSDEWIVPLPSPWGGHSLHVADAAPRRSLRDHRAAYGGLDPLRSRGLAEIAERAALVFATALDAAQRLEAGRVDGAQLRALQARIVQTEKLASVGQIAAKVVHELNNPLTAIVTYAAFLTKKLERSGHDPADVERLRRIGESADRILRFSRELTTYARPHEESATPVAVHEVVERAVVFCEHIVAEYGIQVVTRVEPHTPPILARRGQLTQVFVNLVTNACHAVQDAQRGEAGRIEIVTEPLPHGGVRVSISDNGNGISPEHVVRIFDPFFTTKPEGRGTGLGLSIVRSIVEAHTGRVWVRSVVGSGTSFIVEVSGVRA